MKSHPDLESLVGYVRNLPNLPTSPEAWFSDASAEMKYFYCLISVTMTGQQVSGPGTGVHCDNTWLSTEKLETAAMNAHQ